MSKSEICRVLKRARRLSKYGSTKLNLTIFRLSTCCGLRASEMSGLLMGDVIIVGDRPFISIRKENTKSKTARRIPLWWDAGTLEDIISWRQYRIKMNDNKLSPKLPFVCKIYGEDAGDHLSRWRIRDRFKTLCSKALGKERGKTITTHHGRHSFVSHALAAGRTLAEVRDAAGHSNVSITSIYTHVAVDDDGEIGNIF